LDKLYPIYVISTLTVLGSPGFAVKEAGFGGESVRTHALTPKSG
jgi:hypothetical protein